MCVCVCVCVCVCEEISICKDQFKNVSINKSVDNFELKILMYNTFIMVIKRTDNSDLFGSISPSVPISYRKTSRQPFMSTQSWLTYDISTNVFNILYWMYIDKEGDYV